MYSSIPKLITLSDIGILVFLVVKGTADAGRVSHSFFLSGWKQRFESAVTEYKEVVAAPSAVVDFLVSEVSIVVR